MSSEQESVLVVAFDGLDYELIQDYGLDAVTQKEFGQIDNDTDIHTRNTSELFASFLTGETYETHGVTGLYRWDNETIDRLEDFLEDRRFFSKFYGIRCSLYENLSFIEGGRRRWYAEEDLEQPTIFDQVEDSKSIYVPSYDRNGTLEIGYKVFSKAGIEEGRRLARMEFEKKQEELFNELSNHSRDLLMCHFKYPDTLQDTAVDNGFEDLYLEVDQLAGKIVEKAEDKYDRIIFLSDHGLPLEGEHNKNAFYSCNKEMFGARKPHITDFRGEILAEVG